MSNTYVIHYGWLASDQSGAPNAVARSIAALKVPLLIAHYWTSNREHRNLSAPVLALMHGAGTEVFAYVRTDWGNRDGDDAGNDAMEYLQGGSDGIFFDESDALVSEGKFNYYEKLANAVRAQGRKVILNTGVPRCGECIMRVADRVMLEHQWRDFATYSPWSRRYPNDRFMGVSSNEDNAMGYAVDEQCAIGDTREAWNKGIGWHTSTDHYVNIPEWFGRYVQGITAVA
jgi:hypothetical protein